MRARGGLDGFGVVNQEVWWISKEEVREARRG